MFSLLKGKLLATGAGVIAVLLAAIKILTLQNKRNKRRAEQAEADLQFRDDIDILDAEIDQQFSHRASEADKDEKKVPRNLSDPNDF